MQIFIAVFVTTDIQKLNAPPLTTEDCLLYWSQLHRIITVFSERKGHSRTHFRHHAQLRYLSGRLFRDISRYGDDEIVL
jgi:hypothetical protein